MINKFLNLLSMPIQLDQEALEIKCSLEQFQKDLNLKIKNQKILNWDKFHFMRFLSSNTLGKDEAARNFWQEANLLLNGWIEEEIILEFKNIVHLNKILTQKEDNIRTTKIYAADKEFIETKHFKIVQGYLNQLLKRVDFTPTEKAFRVYQTIVSSHFFCDGNGRTARLISDYILLNNSILPICYPSSIASHVAIDINSEDNNINTYYKTYLLALKNSYQNLLSAN